MNEIWKDIEGYEGLYQVSNLGNVKRLGGVVMMKDGRTKTVKERVLKQSLAGRGYPFVGLCKDNEVKQEYTHKLVSKAFIPNPDNLPEVNHIDEDKTNNRVDNLEWCTRLYNLTYNDRHKKVGLKQIGKKPYNNKPVIQYTVNGEYVAKYDSVMDCAKALDCCESNIRGVIYGKQKTCKGYIFKYEDGSGRWSDEKVLIFKYKDAEYHRNRYKIKKAS